MSFVKFKKNFINNKENKNVILAAQNENETLSFIAMKYRHIKNLPVPLDIEKCKIYIEERDSNKNFIKEIFYDYIIRIGLT